MIGACLSHFRITESLGRGGMGEVYRAEDTKLGREVAVKVLPDAFVADPERVARFEREARVLALNHPNIAGIYEVGEAGPVGLDGDVDPSSVHFLVMELAEGATLADPTCSRGRCGWIPPETASSRCRTSPTRAVRPSSRW